MPKLFLLRITSNTAAAVTGFQISVIRYVLAFFIRYLRMNQADPGLSKLLVPEAENVLVDLGVVGYAEVLHVSAPSLLVTNFEHGIGTIIANLIAGLTYNGLVAIHLDPHRFVLVKLLGVLRKQSEHEHSVLLVVGDTYISDYEQEG
jgi:hypothetical protein